jgi:hypothetical protein
MRPKRSGLHGFAMFCHMLAHDVILSSLIEASLEVKLPTIWTDE